MNVDDFGIDGKKEDSLFENIEEFSNWATEWKGMPEYIQNDAKPIQKIIVNFEKQEDVQKFAELIHQKLTQKTKSIWFPKLNLEKPSLFTYTDEK